MVGKWVQVGLGITAWYLTSFGTLLLNKYLLGTLGISPNGLACVQMTSTAIYGALKTLSAREVIQQARQAWSRRRRKVETSDGNGVDPEDPKPQDAPGSWRRVVLQMAFVGGMRFSTVVLGLVSLQFVAASFTETIKASAPFFTVIITYLMRGEQTSCRVVTSLVPVAGGLFLVSSTELSFNVIGFGAAVATNVIECVQNVFSKRLLDWEYTPTQLQFYTSVTALMLQAPIFLFSLLGAPSLIGEPPGRATALPSLSPSPAVVGSNVAGDGTSTSAMAVIAVTTEPVAYMRGPEWNAGLLALLWVDGVLYHLQSVVAYVVMSHLSPVTVSVINTLKRALLIWISVLVFQNKVTPSAQLGTVICFTGVLLYNYFSRWQKGARPK